MTIAMAGVGPEFGVVVGQVNLTFIWDVISQIRVGKHGQAYVIDEAARLIAHPDISQVLRKTDMSGLKQVQTARSGLSRMKLPVRENSLTSPINCSKASICKASTSQGAAF